MRPLSGVWTASGGTGTRTAAGQAGTQWGDATDLAVTSGSSIATGNSLQVSYLHEDRDSADTITFYLDSDRNPYNNAFAYTLGSVNLGQTNTVTKSTAALSTAGVTPGTYWLVAKVTDAQGDTRYTYNAVTAPLTVTASTGPTASLTSAPNINVGGAASQAEKLVVTYASSAPINVTSLDSADLQVTGPGFKQLATYVGVSASSGSYTRVATYSIPAPAGGWTTANNGAYTVAVQANQVYDTSKQYVPSGMIGSFSVALGGSLAGSQNAPASSYNLTTLGTADWAYWGRGATLGNFDHKATGGSQISNVTTLGNGSYGGYSDNSRNASWTDGTPDASDTNEHGYIWANNAIGAGYSFTAPADTTTRTLYIDAGGYSSGGTLTAHLSDKSAADVVFTASGNALYTNLYTITYRAASAGQKLTISYVKSTNINGTGGSVDLIAAYLAGAPVADTTKPQAVLQAVPPITSSSTAVTLKVVYTDNVAVNASSLASGNIGLTGPTSQTAKFVSASPSGNGATITATYSVAAPSGGWTMAANGSYTVTLVGGSVADTSNNFAVQATLGNFQIAIPASGAGSLSGVQAVAASSYNLTALGTSDWAHWGRGNVYGNFDHKAAGSSQISNVTVLGSGNVGSYYDPSRAVSWNDGAPTASDSADNAYIWANNAIGAGYSFTVPADTTTRTLYVYAGGNSSGSTLTAHLSGGAAPDVVLSASGNGLYTNLYTITYKAASAGQTLTISYVKSTNINGNGGSVDLIAAALVAG